jgi:LacI family transcriptional regulator, repressor for deo operon, udp, cdd, tsx, nupC, and nupG
VDIFMPDHLWGRLLEGELPAATIGVDTGLLDAVVIDNRSAAVEAVTHLLDLGHRRIGYIGGAVGESVDLESAELRRLGMVEAMTSRSVEPDPGLQVPGGFSVEGGREAMADLLEIGPPTAAFCASDEMAVGAIQATVEAGLQVPDDVSVVGFDDQPMAAAVGLTTIHQPVPEQAARATAMVLARLEDRSAPVVVEEMPTHLCVRRTSGPVT